MGDKEIIAELRAELDCRKQIEQLKAEILQHKALADYWRHAYEEKVGEE